MGCCRCERKENRNYYNEYNDLKYENDKLKEKLKINDLSFNLDNRYGSQTQSTSEPTKPIKIKFNGNSYDLMIKELDSISKVLYRLNKKYPNLECKGTCTYNNEILTTNKIIVDLNIPDNAELQVQ